ncbi:hypothetical protein CC86DRAFT_191419 [Ophiobolus disseminans]|uniref:Uncharacterized protein n=1 Tax=Ophiobolus disseminans TaxID=1469910 RepID=A0A6A7AA44_9PLEO|nr:hypothetical protein CC86DRAFT_191419 [Ophiobolus disseminans]
MSFPTVHTLAVVPTHGQRIPGGGRAIEQSGSSSSSRRSITCHCRTDSRKGTVGACWSVPCPGDSGASQKLDISQCVHHFAGDPCLTLAQHMIHMSRRTIPMDENEMSKLGLSSSARVSSARSKARVYSRYLGLCLCQGHWQLDTT